MNTPGGRGGNSFGARDRPTCPRCGGTMSVIRRTPHPEHGFRFEKQTLCCSKCRHEIERSAGEDGRPHAAD